jgi:hypothetical protein
LFFHTEKNHSDDQKKCRGTKPGKVLCISHNDSFVITGITNIGDILLVYQISRQLINLKFNIALSNNGIHMGTPNNIG